MSETQQDSRSASVPVLQDEIARLRSRLAALTREANGSLRGNRAADLGPDLDWAARLDAFLERGDVVAWTASPDGRMDYLNGAVERLFWGRLVDDPLATDPGARITTPPWLPWVHPADLPAIAAASASLEREGSSQLDYRIVGPTGEIRWLHDHRRKLVGPHGHSQGYAGMVHDITAAKTWEQATQEWEQRYRTMVENAAEAIVVFDVDQQRFVDFNERALRLFQLEPTEMSRCGPMDLSPPRQPSGTTSAELVVTVIQAALDGETPVFEWTHCTGDGTPIPCEVRLARVPAREQRLVRGSVTDISRRKADESEREELIGELKRKNEELERFTYTVSHDLKSPLITIAGFLGLLEQDIEDGKPAAVKSDLLEIRTATERMKSLLDHLLHLSRIGRVTDLSQEVDLQGVVEEALGALRGPIAARSAAVDVQPGLPTVRGDFVRLREVFQNLVENGLKFTPPGEAARIRIQWERREKEVLIQVSDHAIGIEPPYRERVFDLFEQLNPDQEGTGIGLTVARRVVELHGGRLWIEGN